MRRDALADPVFGMRRLEHALYESPADIGRSMPNLRRALDFMPTSLVPLPQVITLGESPLRAEHPLQDRELLWPQKVVDHDRGIRSRCKCCRVGGLTGCIEVTGIKPVFEPHPAREPHYGRH